MPVMKTAKTCAHIQLGEPEYRTLQSDLIQQVVAAVTQQQQAHHQQQQQQEMEEEEEEEEGEGEREGNGKLVNSALLELRVCMHHFLSVGRISLCCGSCHQDEFQEEYVTEAYKRQQQKVHTLGFSALVVSPFCHLLVWQHYEPLCRLGRR